MMNGSTFDDSIHGCIDTHSNERTVYGDIDLGSDAMRVVGAAPRTMRRIGIVVREGFSLLRLGAISEVFQLANERASACAPRETGAVAYDVRMLSTRGGSVRSASSAHVLTECIQLDRRNRFDALFSVGGYPADADLHARFYWSAPPVDATLGPRVIESADAVRSALTLIKRDLGHNVAREIGELVLPSAEARADLLLHDIGVQTVQEKIRASALWLDENCGRTITVADAVQAAVMSSRSYSRHFKLELGVTPSEYLLRARLELACRMLTGTDLPIEKIARRCGIGGGDRLGKIFRKVFCVSPTEYRQGSRSALKQPSAIQSASFDAGRLAESVASSWY